MTPAPKHPHPDSPAMLKEGHVSREMCSKCFVRKRVPRQRWCKSCRAKYMREWRAAQRLKAEGRAAELKSLKDVVRRVTKALAAVFILSLMLSVCIAIPYCDVSLPPIEAQQAPSEPFRIVEVPDIEAECGPRTEACTRLRQELANECVKIAAKALSKELE